MGQLVSKNLLATKIVPLLYKGVIEAYEAENYEIPDCSGVDMLIYFMEEHSLTQSDLPEIGSQGVVSEIINGKRELNIRQVRALAERFKVSSLVFL